MTIYEVTLPIIIIILYIVGTTIAGSMSVKYTKNTAIFMSAKNLMGPWVVGILLMSEFVATGATLGSAEEAHKSGISAA
jgi:SSS family solute:Na+ symporter